MVFRFHRLLHSSGIAVLLLTSLPLWGGCGYRLAAAGSDTVAVRVNTLTNDSIEPGIGLTLAAALRRETERTPGFRLVESAGVPAYTVSGRVRSVDTFGRTFTPSIIAIEYTVTIQLDVILRGPGQELLKVDPFAQQASEIYLASADLQISQKNREEALRRVSMLLADRLLAEIQRIAAARAGAFLQTPWARLPLGQT
ncbi:LPS assembly lipoprotein LptE [Myxococcota bacterium]|nr:LPS assembly lipoprotein LptE [Myxococcota bacterium]